MDLIIRNANLPDGTEGVDIAIRDGRIIAVEAAIQASAHAEIDAAGKPFWHPEADAALFQSLRNWIYPTELLVELDLHINDPAFAEAAARLLLGMMEAKRGERGASAP